MLNQDSDMLSKSALLYRHLDGDTNQQQSKNPGFLPNVRFLKKYEKVFENVRHEGATSDC